jgi:WD40 repeat protein
VGYKQQLLVFVQTFALFLITAHSMIFTFPPVATVFQKWKPTKVRSYEKEEASRRKRSGLSSSASSSNLAGSSSHHSSRRSKARPRLDTADGSAPGSPSHGNALISAHGSSNNLSLRQPERTVAKAGGVRFDSSPRSRGNSDAVTMEEMAGAPPPQSPALSSHRSYAPDRISTANPNSTSANTSANSTQRTTFNSGGTAHVLDEHLSAQQFAFLPENKLLFTCGHWDHSCRITYAENGNLVQSVRQHRDVITCLALAKDFGQRWLVTGSRDCTLMVWDVNLERDLPLKSQPQYILYGHDDAVTCVAVNPELDVVVSGSDDGTVIIHNLRDGTYVRSIVDNAKTYASLSKAMSSAVGEAGGIGAEEMQGAELVDERGRRRSMRPSSSALAAANGSGNAQAGVRKVTWVGLSKDAYVITYSADEQILCTYSLNGLLIASRSVPEALYAFMLSEDGKVLLTGGSSCLVVFRWVSCSSLRRIYASFCCIRNFCGVKRLVFVCGN